MAFNSLGVSVQNIRMVYTHYSCGLPNTLIEFKLLAILPLKSENEVVKNTVHKKTYLSCIYKIKFLMYGNQHFCLLPHSNHI